MAAAHGFKSRRGARRARSFLVVLLAEPREALAGELGASELVLALVAELQGRRDQAVLVADAVDLGVEDRGIVRMVEDRSWRGAGTRAAARSSGAQRARRSAIWGPAGAPVRVGNASLIIPRDHTHKETL